MDKVNNRCELYDFLKSLGFKNRNQVIWFWWKIMTVLERRNSQKYLNKWS